jgi:hypothetical protein
MVVQFAEINLMINKLIKLDVILVCLVMYYIIMHVLNAMMDTISISLTIYANLVWLIVNIAILTHRYANNA